MKSLRKKTRVAELKCLLAIALATAWGSMAQAATCSDNPLVLGPSETLDCTAPLTVDASTGAAVTVSGSGADLEMNGATLTTHDTNAAGAFASSGGHIHDKGPTAITTEGNNAYGVNVQADSYAALGGAFPPGITSNRTSVRLGTGTSILTQGVSAHGVFVDGGSSGGDVSVDIFDDVTITTNGDYANGVNATSQGETMIWLDQGATITSAGIGVVASGKTLSITNFSVINAVGSGISASTSSTSSPSEIDNSGGITSRDGHGIDVFGAQGINTIENSGDITALGNPVAGVSGTYAIYGGHGKENVTVSDGIIQGNIHLGGENDVLLADSGTFVGGIYMGSASDVATFNPLVDLTRLTVLDGEGPLQYSGTINPDDERSKGSNTLNLNNTLVGSTTGADVGKAGNALIANWDFVNIGPSPIKPSRLDLTGGLDNGRGDGSMGAMRIYPSGTLALAKGTSVAKVAYDVSNMGTIDLTQGSAAPTGVLTIAGDYDIGKATSSKLLVKSTWNNPDEQQNDKLVIEGNATGDTRVSVPGGIIGNVTQGDVVKNGGLKAPVVTVQGTDTGPNLGLTFAGTADTTNAGQAQLVKIDKSYYWTLKTVEPGGNGGDGGGDGGGGGGGNDGGGGEGGKPILIPGASGYTQMSRIDREMGFAQLSKLHERVGEQQTWAWDNCGTMCAEYRQLTEAGKRPHPIWGRMSFGTLEEQGEDRLGYKSDNGFIQFGTDLNVKTDEARNHRHIGVTASYGHGEHDFYDKYRAENGRVADNKHTGTGTTDIFSLGAYSTWYRTNGAYVDLVGNASFLHNKYESASGNVGQNGYGLGASVEVGRPWQLGSSNWQIEPQAQLSYQYVHLSSFDDDVRSIGGQSDGTLRGRLGARLAWNADNGHQRTNTFYVAVNVLHDLVGNKSKADIGSDDITEHYGSTWGEVSVGGQVALSKSVYLFGDVRYDRSMGSYSNEVFRSSGVAREGYSGRVGVRYSW